MSGGHGDGDPDLGGLGDKLNWLAADLRRTSDEMRRAVDTAATLSYEAASDDGLVRVTVNGRGRVTSLRLSPYVSRSDPDTVDELLTATLNDALAQARSGSQRAVMDALPPAMRVRIGPAVDDAQTEAWQ
jgi:DNA-binding protein YbaB